MIKYTEEELKIILEKHKKWLKNEVDGEQADLSSADLRYANLRSANLRSADLRYADLSSANLRWADLHSADLRWADLRWADLHSADLSYADLSSADLRSADLSYADLSSADLHSADLSSADLDLEIYQLSRIGSENRMTIWDATNDIVFCGCFKGSMTEFEKKIEETHKYNALYLSQYRLAIKYLKDLRDLKASLK